jgi:putative hydrolase of the HAD superfamily
LERRHAEILEVLHVDVLEGRRTIDEARRERFARLLAAAGADRIGDRAGVAASFYRTAYERSWQAVPGALELAAALSARRTPFVIVTNNGVAEQRRKLERVGLDRHLSALVTSEEVGVAKPARRIFEVALEAGGAGPGEAVMLGDAWHSDIAGAQAVGIAAIWFNRLGLESPDASVPELRELEPTDDVLARLLRGH